MAPNPLSHSRKISQRVSELSMILLAAGIALTTHLKAEGPVQGYLHVWGDFWDNNLADNGRPTPEELGLVIDYASDRSHQSAILVDGSVATWGRGDVAPETIPPANGEPRIVSLTASSSLFLYTLALRDDGSAIDWPETNRPTFGPPVAQSSIRQFEAGSLDSIALAIEDDGTITTWSRSGNTWTASEPPIELGNVQDATVGHDHFLVLREDGTVYAWDARGRDNQAVTNIPADLQNVVAIAAGAHSVMVTADGRLHAFGSPSAIADIPTDRSDFIDVAAAGGRTIGLTREGRVEVWNSSTDLTPRIPSDVRVSAIFTGAHYIAVLADRPFPVLAAPLEPEVVNPGHTATLAIQTPHPEDVSYQWFKDDEIIPGATERVFEITSVTDADAGNYTVSLTNPNGTTISSSAPLSVIPPQPGPSQGSLHVWGSEAPSLPEGDDFTKVAAGADHALFLRADGTVAAAGTNRIGETDIPQNLPTIIDIGAGQHHSLAVTDSGNVLAWGENRAGQATPPEGLTDIVAIAGGALHSVALRRDGSVVAWGANGQGQTDVPQTASDVIKIAATGHNTLALRRDGTVVGWGRNRQGQTDVPSDLANVIDIALGAEQSIALQADGKLVTWGETRIPAAELAETLPSVTAISANADLTAYIQADGAAGVYKQIFNRRFSTTGTVLSIAAGNEHVYYIEAAPAESHLQLTLSRTEEAGSPLLRLIVRDGDGTPLSPSENPGLLIESRTAIAPNSPWQPIALPPEGGTDSFLIEPTNNQEYFRARLLR